MSEYQLLKQITAGYQKILGGNLIGIYLHGSMAFGCYDRRVSDIDFIAAVHTPPNEEERIALIRLLLSLDQDAPPKGFEMSVVLGEYCRKFVYPTPYELHFSNSYREEAAADPHTFCRRMRGTDRDLAAHFTVIRAVGQTLCGEPIDTLFCEVPRRAYIDSLLHDVGNAAVEIADDPVYMTLNLCRVLAYLRDCTVLSKRGGGEWGIRNLSPQYHEQIQSALCAYAGEAVYSDPDAGHAFAEYMIQEIRREIHD